MSKSTYTKETLIVLFSHNRDIEYSNEEIPVIRSRGLTKMTHDAYLSPTLSIQ